MGGRKLNCPGGGRGTGTRGGIFSPDKSDNMLILEGG